MPLLSCILSQKKITLHEEKILYDNTSSSYSTLKSKYKANNDSFCTLNFSNESLDSNILVCKSSGLVINFIGDITNRVDLVDSIGINKNVSNAAIVMHAYKKWGESFSKKIYGFFSIIIYAPKERLLIAVNDHLGSKPIYFYKSINTFLISSKIKTLLGFIDKKKINSSRVRDYFIFFNGKPGETFFRDIYRLEPGSQIIFKNNKLSIKKYFLYDPSKKRIYKNDFEYEEHFKEIFLQTISSLSTNLNNDKIGSSLSGGVDSSSITCALKHLGKNVIPQTVLFDGLFGKDAAITNEKKYVDDVSKQYDLKTSFIKLKNSGCISEYPKAIEYNDEPPSLINGYIHSAIFENLKKNNIDTLFDGFDGDTSVSHGYEHLFELGRKFKLFKLFKEYSLLHKNQNIGNVNYFKAIKQYCIKSYVPKKIFWYKNKYSKNPMIPLKWYKRLDSKKVESPSYDEILMNYNGLPIPNLYSKNSRYAHYLDIINPTIEMSLNLINHNANEYGIDIKFPFLDRRLIEFCVSIPSDQKLREGVSRSILKRSLKDILPSSVLKRYDKSDLSPFSRNQIYNLDNSLILKSAENIPFLDIDFIKDNLLKNKSENMMEIYQIIIFDAWLRKNNF